ncbi:protein containing integrase core domain, partial [Bacteroidales bacterium 6E]
DTTEGIYLIGN